MGKEEYMKLEQVDGDDEEAVVEAWLVRPQLLLPAARRWLQRGAAASDPSHSAQAHEITVELATPISVDQQEELLQTKFWCRYAARMVWAQARIVIPICTYVIAFKDGVLGGATAGIVPLVLAVLATCVGLALFLEGLQLGVMPLSEALGSSLPKRAPLPVTLLVAGTEPELPAPSGPSLPANRRWAQACWVWA